MLVLLLGCASGWIDQTPACDANPYEWTDDLLAHILTGDGQGGFDYDPADTPRTSIAGSYDVTSGDFAWDVGYDQKAYQASTAVVGYGTAYHNGNLDIQYTTTMTDVLDVVSTTETRYERVGCAATTWAWSEDGAPEDAVQVDGVYTEDLYSWTAADSDWSYDGTDKPDLSGSRHLVAADASWDQTDAWSPDGTATRDFVGDDTCADGYACDGHVDMLINGSYTFTQHLLDGSDIYCTITGEIAYDGDGTEHYDCTDQVCDLEIVDGDCTYTCEGGQSGSC